MASINYFKFGPDGAKITIAETFYTVAFVAALTNMEEITGGNTWVKKYSRPVSDLATWLVTESRPIPGNPVNTKEMDKDGKQVLVVRTITADADITAGDAIAMGVWTQTSSEPISALVSNKVVRTRDVPCNAIIARETVKDGAVQTTTRTLKDRTTITPVEEISSTTYRRVGDDPVTEKVSWEVKIERPIAIA